MEGRRPSAIWAAVVAVSTALVCVATMAIKIDIVATRGYFNLGETMVYTVSILFGPVVGAIAGGVGSALADVLLAALIYAPATLLIKGAEGFLVGFLSKRGAKLGQRAWSAITIIAALISGSLLGSIGAYYYSGEACIGIGHLTLTVYVPTWLWVCLGVALSVFIVALGLGAEPEVGWLVLATLLGGLIMVLGYLAYETALFGLLAALAEVPFNIGQVVIGLAVAIPLTRAIARRLPQLMERA
ncbi:MAG TPA: hypothetical protein ENF78_05700 [Candidatus Bathyarchaeota archaeon]|nr:hypothetical protein [Candidatus Bathyarchaeota archaeon]